MLAAVLLAAASLVGVTAVADEEPPAAPPRGDAPRSERTPQPEGTQTQRARQEPEVLNEISAGALAKSPMRYFGKLVRVRSEVEDVLSQRVFTLDEDEPGDSPDVLVVAPALRNDAQIEEGDDLIVIGRVERFVDATFRRELDPLRLTTVEMTYVRTRPVVRAESIRTRRGGELVARPTAQNVAFAATVGAITSRPRLFEGDLVMIRNAEVEDQPSPEAIRLDDERFLTDDDLTVLAPRSLEDMRIREGVEVSVRGRVEIFDARNLTREYPWLNAEELESRMGDLDGKPVLIAEWIEANGATYDLGRAQSPQEPTRRPEQPPAGQPPSG